jgi:hypothetical protein
MKKGKKMKGKEKKRKGKENSETSIILHVLREAQNLQLYEFPNADQEKHETPK